jgi:hypothetical protein
MPASDFTLVPQPDFQQIFDASLSSLERVVIHVLAQHPVLKQCYFSDEHCDCRDLATVHHLASELEFCDRHFAIVNKAVHRG